MLILPLIDALVLLGTATLGVGFLMKAIDVTTRFHPSIGGFTSLDFLLMTGVFWGFALTLVARTWVRLNEGNLARARREQIHAEAQRRVRDYEMHVEPVPETPPQEAASGGPNG